MARRTTASLLLVLAVHSFALGTLITRPGTTTAIFAAATLVLLACETALVATRYRHLERATKEAQE